MFARILKSILKNVTLDVSYKQGDLLRVIITLGNRIVLDRTIDVIKGA